ncbi:MAG: sigma-54-dependent Fis family transcriptional regulator, partial [Firmicutes bacterium]|nr:sigma-54-dependent Fis family transcriptional regulator [Bacillota bacterium]
MLVKIDKRVIETLKSYHWPGNVRELQNVMERAVNVCQHPVLTMDDLPDFKVAENTRSFLSMELYERDMIKNLLERYNDNITRVAGELGVARSTLYRKIYKYKLEYQSSSDY